MSSLYIHIPFCERKCVYCDFYSIENLGPMDAFLRALEEEIGCYGERGAGVTFNTVFFGGGTPSLLEPEQLERIIRRLHETFTIDRGAEVTLEMNPGTVTPDKLAAYRSAGVNRLSIGIQSFRDNELRFLGRIHDAADGSACVGMARGAGFNNISIDLMYSLPGQSPAQWEETLQKALALAPEHLSAYSLIVEDNTPLARMVASRQVSPNPVETEAALYEQTMETMARHGFEHYEVSNYARPGRRSRHNEAYWSHVDYLGFGPSAHSFWKEGHSARRWANSTSVSAYCEKLVHNSLPVSMCEELTPRQLLNETIFLGLRSDGVDLRSVGWEGGSDPSGLIRALVAEGKAELEGDRVRLTPRGYLLCDEIAGRLMI